MLTPNGAVFRPFVLTPDGAVFRPFVLTPTFARFSSSLGTISLRVAGRRFEEQEAMTIREKEQNRKREVKGVSSPLIRVRLYHTTRSRSGGVDVNCLYWCFDYTNYVIGRKLLVTSKQS